MKFSSAQAFCSLISHCQSFCIKCFYLLRKKKKKKSMSAQAQTKLQIRENKINRADQRQTSTETKCL